ncbi:MAG: ribosome hibernation-promoting factor, HPF/YfiA family [Micrococcales bacterium]
MDIQISARNLTVSDRFRDYVQDRAHKVENLTHRVESLIIKVTRHEHKSNGQEDQVELTVIEPGHVVRAEAHAGDKFAAFDIALNKLAERLRRAADRNKVHRGQHRQHSVSEISAHDFAELDVTPVDADLLLGKATAATEAEEANEYGESPVVIRRKEFNAKPMTVDEALYHMELVGHDFYLFLDESTQKPSVVYRRKGWNYGLLTLS